MRQHVKQAHVNYHTFPVFLTRNEHLSSFL